MDCKKPTLGKGFFSLFIFTFLISLLATGQSSEQRKLIANSYDAIKFEELISSFKKEAQIQEQQVQSLAKHNQWQLSKKELDGTVVALNSIGTDGTPLFYTTYMNPTSKVSRADSFYKGGALDADIAGFGMQVGVWDAGTALTTHQEFDYRVINADHSQEIDSHGTMVTGTLVSSGVREKARGIAFKAEARTYNWTRDKIEVAEAAANGLLLSNHSYGIKTDRVPDWYFGSYIKVSQDWDKIMYNAPYYLMVSAAGNSQNSYDNERPNYGKSQDGFDLLLGFTTAKNGLVVAGADVKLTNNGGLKDATVSRYSSFGPIDDGRIKPDLAGDGSLIYSTSSNNNSSYHSAMGTSMAAPGVTGSLLLLQQYHEELYSSFMKASTLKGLALHTADDVQAPGPDYKMGWGVLNTQRAGEVLKNKEYSSIVNEERLNDGDSYSITVQANGNEPLIASISWTDIEGTYINRGDFNATTAALVNDLDIRITKNEETYFPWKLRAAQADAEAITGDNVVDPFERVDVTNAWGEYTITVSHKGKLQHGAQAFSLIVTGAKLTPCSLSEAPENLEIEMANESGCTLVWNAEEDILYELQYKETYANNWMTITSWEGQTILEDLSMGEIYRVRVRAVCSQNLTSEFSEELQFEFNGADTEALFFEPLSYTEELSMHLYPNPAVEELHVSADISKDAYYTIRSTSGNTIKSGNANEIIDVADLSSGLYVITLQDYSGIKSAKFFKD
ncbi:S8 family serine peptidase [Croceitalea rosinachiae]|uniref:S8 family serine peptidase n=1 Tax=Croceitalea rosinachiae TaxID=3075596 RepID=A0ABU3A7K1_9FLAO|nr:S8 family serine peptidase [Croceitalea sp. F388]MDT0606141.1 S8 family serine peptidase [Croceitalea sp. F388]